MIRDREGQPTVGEGRIQGGPCAALPRRLRVGPSGAKNLILRWFAGAALTAPLMLVGGCSSVPSAINPVSWWHSLQGGAIAEQRPPPPGATDPYPNLASVPPAPAQPDRAALNQITDQLIADRTNAQHEAAAAPLADPSSPSASPALFGAGTTPPPGPPGQTPKPGAPAPSAASSTAPGAGPTPGGPPASGPTSEPVASASMPAAPAPAPPPAPIVPPAKAPVGAVNSAPLAPPAATPAGAANDAPLAPPGETPAETAPLPQIAAAPPPAPNVPGFAVPTAAASATSTPPPATMAGDAVTVPFADGSALLPASATAPLKQLAAKRGAATISVVGYGEASGATVDAQSTALTLGLARAQAMAAVLTASGVPAGSVQIDAQAIGRGGSARLIQ
jgi:outer membrane protein OmpA-like peptidoglycan-associated protein